MPQTTPPLGKKISQLIEVTQVAGNEYIIVATGGVNRKLALSTVMSGITNPNLTLLALGLDKVDNTSDMNKPISTAVQNALNGKADIGHTHTAADIVDLNTILSTKADVIALNNKADLSHTHGINDVTGLQSAINSKADITSLAGKADVNHIHAILDVTGLQTALDNKASILHGHTITDVIGLQAQLDAKANNTHTHGIVDVTGLQTALDSKASSSHVHTSSDISDLTQAIQSLTLPAVTATVNATQAGLGNLEVDAVFSTTNGYYMGTVVCNVRYKLQTATNWVSGTSQNFIDGTLNYTLSVGPVTTGTYDIEFYLSDVNNPSLNIVVSMTQVFP